MIRYNRQRLKAHDAGSDRHSKSVAYDRKKERLTKQHQRVVGGRRRRSR